MVAAGKGREEEAMVLLANGADPRLRAKDGSSAADWADRRVLRGTSTRST